LSSSSHDCRQHRIRSSRETLRMAIWLCCRGYEALCHRLYRPRRFEQISPRPKVKGTGVVGSEWRSCPGCCDRSPLTNIDQRSVSMSGRPIAVDYALPLLEPFVRVLFLYRRTSLLTLSLSIGLPLRQTSLSMPRMARFRTSSTTTIHSCAFRFLYPENRILYWRMLWGPNDVRELRSLL